MTAQTAQTAAAKPVANWSRIAPGTFFARLDGADLYAGGSRGAWSFVVKRDGRTGTRNGYRTKLEAQAAAEAELRGIGLLT